MTTTSQAHWLTAAKPHTEFTTAHCLLTAREHVWPLSYPRLGLEITDWPAHLSPTPSLNLKMELQIPPAISSRVMKNCSVLSAAKSPSTSLGMRRRTGATPRFTAPWQPIWVPCTESRKPQAWHEAHAHQRYFSKFPITCQTQVWHQLRKGATDGKT